MRRQSHRLRLPTGKAEEMGAPISEAQQRAAERRGAFGVGIGLVPAVLMTLFGFTHCPIGPMYDSTCHDPNQGIGGYLFVAAVAVYLSQAVVMLIFFIPRATRPLAWGLLVMLFIGPLLGALGFYAVAVARHSHSTNAGALLLPTILVRAAERGLPAAVTGGRPSGMGLPGRFAR